MDKYDYIELVTYDIHSVPRGRLVARRRVMPALKKGIALYTGMCYFGIKHEPNVMNYFGAARNFGNGQMVPILDTLVDGLKSARGDRKVGNVMCELRLQDGTVEPSTPRYVAQRQVEKLSEAGFTIRSSHEIEFTLVDQEGKFWRHDSQWADMNVVSRNQDVLLEMIEEMHASGVKVDSLQAEAGSGQYEVNMDIAEGLEGPDMTSRFKSMSKVFFQKRSMASIFMTKPTADPMGLANGFHFNHSLWTKDGTNVFMDQSKPNRLSTTGRQWLAGLIAHVPALTALCCPTVNCYRRLFGGWTPGKSDWGVQSRVSAFRLVTESDNIYIEFRLPSSACNPYLVMAGVIAAGLDGIHRELSLDKADQEVPLPKDLETALTLLEQDDVLVQELGREFIDCFTYTKRTFEIASLNNIKDEGAFEAEKKMYFDNC